MAELNNKSLVSSANYLTDLDSTYSKYVTINKNNIHIPSGISHTVELTISVFNKDNLTDDSFVSTGIVTDNSTMIDYLNSINDTVKSVITDAEIMYGASINSNSVGDVTYSFECTTTDTIIKSISIKVIYGNVTKYDIKSTSNDYIKLFTNAGLLSKEELAKLALSVENIDNITTVSENINSVNTVSDNISDVNTVSSNMTDVNTLVSNIDKVIVVNDNISDVVNVSDNIDEIKTSNLHYNEIKIVSDNIVDVNIVSDNIDDVNTNANNVLDIKNVSTNISDINTVSNDLNLVDSTVKIVSANISDVNTVSDNMSSVIVVNDNISDINTVSININDVNTVNDNINSINVVNNNIDKIITDANNIGSISIVANDLSLSSFSDIIDAGSIEDPINSETTENSSNIVNVSHNISEVVIVADNIDSVVNVSNNIVSINNVETIITNVVDVSTISSDVTVVAGISTDVTTVSTNISDIQNVENNILDINTVSLNILNVNKVATVDDEINTISQFTSEIKTVSDNINNVNSVGSNINAVIGVNSNQFNINAVVAEVIPNMTEILESDNNAAIATSKALEASISETLAHRWAQEPEDSPVTGVVGSGTEEYSAYHYAKKAEAIIGGNITLDSLYDVDTTGVVDGGIVRWNQIQGKYLAYDFEHNDKIGFDTTAGVTVATGEMAWNLDEGCIDIGMNNGSTLQVGQEELRTVRNSIATTITNGTLCMFNGTIGNSGRIKVKPFSAGFNEAMYLYGVATQNIISGSDGLITISGKARGIDTSGASVGEVWNDEDILYAKPNDGGRMTNVVPADNELRLVVATVIKAHHTNGTLEIRFMPFNENAYYTKAQSDALLAQRVPLNSDFSLDLGSI